MADTASLFKGGAAPVGGAAPAPAGATINPSAPAAGGNINPIMKSLMTASTLSAEGVDYIKKIEAALKEVGFEYSLTRIGGQANYEAYALKVADITFGFLMLETVQYSGDGMPPAAYSVDFRLQVQQQAGWTAAEADNCQWIAIRKSEYGRADLMAAYVVNTIKAETDSTYKHLSIDAFRNQTFKVTTDQERVMSYIRACWPVEINDRHDVGFLIYGTAPIPGQVGADGRQAVETIPLVAVTGYTEFYYTKSGSMYAAEVRHAPFFVITGVYSRLPARSLTALGIAASATVFITNGQWLEPYSRYTKGSPDIGNLARDESTGKLYTVQDLVSRNNILNNYLTSKVPRLLVDIQHGRPLMPGLKELITNPAKLNAAVDAFTGGRGASSARGVVQFIRKRFDGVCKINRNGVAEEVDTRTIDPLYLIAQGVDAGDAADLYRMMLDGDLNQDALKRAEIIKRFVPGTQMLYVTARAALEPEWVCNVTNDMNKTIMLEIDGSFADTTYDVASIRGFDVENLGAMPMFSSGLAPVGLWSNSGNFGF